MRIANVAVMAGLMAVGAWAKETPVHGRHDLTICTDGGGDFRAIGQAHAIAAGMFSSIGVNVTWHPGFKDCPAQGILITVVDRTRPETHPGALAYALPYEGVHIWILYDRISLAGSRLAPILMAHVLAHEIGHILQGEAHHSKTGVMKAAWTQDDYNSMLTGPLGFTPADVDLIQRGAEARASRLFVISADRQPVSPASSR